VGVVVGVIACVMGVTAGSRRRVAIMAVAMPAVTVPRPAVM
jgi:hypothetical protein